jgi:hypothetical protein
MSKGVRELSVEECALVSGGEGGGLMGSGARTGETGGSDDMLDGGIGMGGGGKEGGGAMGTGN